MGLAKWEGRSHPCSKTHIWLLTPSVLAGICCRNTQSIARADRWTFQKRRLVPLVLSYTFIFLFVLFLLVPVLHIFLLQHFLASILTCFHLTLVLVKNLALFPGRRFVCWVLPLCSRKWSLNNFKIFCCIFNKSLHVESKSEILSAFSIFKSSVWPVRYIW